jgi:Fe2+ transport system protein B
MWLIFQTTFTWIGTPLSDQLDAFFSGPLTDWLKAAIYPESSKSEIKKNNTIICGTNTKTEPTPATIPSVHFYRI